jgi:hypothetical protein
MVQFLSWKGYSIDEPIASMEPALSDYKFDFDNYNLCEVDETILDLYDTENNNFYPTNCDKCYECDETGKKGFAYGSARCGMGSDQSTRVYAPRFTYCVSKKYAGNCPRGYTSIAVNYYATTLVDCTDVDWIDTELKDAVDTLATKKYHECGDDDANIDVDRYNE